MATTSIWQRDVGSSISDVKTTYSSWDTCMEKSYCKWPAIIGIVVASLIIISLLTCLFRCLCCGVECCCACFKCCNACCPSPRRRGGREGYQQTPAPQPPAQPFPTRDQYVQKLSMQYGSGAPAVARTATFDTPSRARTNVSTTSHNDDALPAMPSWDAAREKRIEASTEEHPEEMEMTRLKSPRVQSPSTQQSQALPRRENASPYGENVNHPAPAAYPVRRQGDDNFANHQTPISPVASPHQDLASSGDVGTLSAAPYHEYSRGDQFAPSPYGSQRTTDNPPPMYAAHNPTNVAVAMPYSSTDSRVEPAQYGHDGRQQQRNQYQQDGYGSRAQQPQYGQGGYNSGPRQPQSPQDEYGSRPQQPQYGQGSYGSRPQQPQPQQGGYDGRPQQPRPQQGGYDSRPQQPRPQQGAYDSRSQQPQPQRGGYDSRQQQPRPQQGGYDSRPQQPRPQQDGYDSRPQQPRPQQDGYDSRTQQGGYDSRPQQRQYQQEEHDNRQQHEYQQDGYETSIPPSLRNRAVSPIASAAPQPQYPGQRTMQ